jgi:homocysteine S-methyltransferase
LIPDFAFKQMSEAGDHGAAVGVKLAADLANHLKSIAQGIYLMPAFGRYDHAAEIIESIQ